MPKTKKTKKAKIVAEATTPVYKITLKSLGRLFKSEGETLEEALRKIKITGGAKAMATMRVEKGETIKDNIMIRKDIAQKAFSEVGPTMKDFGIKNVMERIGL